MTNIRYTISESAHEQTNPEPIVFIVLDGKLFRRRGDSELMANKNRYFQMSTPLEHDLIQALINHPDTVQEEVTPEEVSLMVLEQLNLSE